MLAPPYGGFDPGLRVGRFKSASRRATSPLPLHPPRAATPKLSLLFHPFTPSSSEELRVGQKIHPTGFRLGVIQDHRSRWYADGQRYPELLQEDHQIRQYVEKNLSNAGISDVRIERKADQIDLEVRTARPGVVVGRGGSGIEALRVGLQKALKDPSRQIRINVVEVARVDADAALVAEYIVQQLERRVAFRRWYPPDPPARSAGWRGRHQNSGKWSPQRS
jgi:predicted RNA-binding protein YlqC (UPF0109 family)